MFVGIIEFASISHVYYSPTNKLYLSKSRDSVVDIATTRWLDRSFESRQGQEFSLLHVVQNGSGVHPTSYPKGTGGSFPGG
jgi:hypothetical protein